MKRLMVIFVVALFAFVLGCGGAKVPAIETPESPAENLEEAVDDQLGLSEEEGEGEEGATEEGAEETTEEATEETTE